MNGAKKIMLFGEEVTVNAKVFIINGFSVMPDRMNSWDWLGTMQGKPTKVILVHGEAEVQQEFGALITEKYGFEVHIPEYMEELELEPGAALQPVVDMGCRPVLGWIGSSCWQIPSTSTRSCVTASRMWRAAPGWIRRSCATNCLISIERSWSSSPRCSHADSRWDSIKDAGS